MTHNDRCSHAETKRSKCKCSCGGELHGLQSQDYSRPKNDRDMYYICKDKFDFPDPTNVPTSHSFNSQVRSRISGEVL